MITFRQINKYNYTKVIELDPGLENISYTSPIWKLMLSAHYIGNCLEMKAIYNNGIIIGFFMISYDIKPIYIESLVIDKIYQNKGLGNICIQKIIRYIKNNYRADRIYISTSNPIAFHIYQKNGFLKLNNKMADNYKKKYKEFLLIYKLK